MTNQDKIAWLRRYREAAAEQDRLMAEIARWRSLAERVSPTLSGMPAGSGGPARMIAAVERLDELEAELAEQIVERVATRREIGQAIDRGTGRAPRAAAAAAVHRRIHAGKNCRRNALLL